MTLIVLDGIPTNIAIGLLNILLGDPVLATTQGQAVLQVMLDLKVLAALADRLRPCFVKGEEREAKLGIPCQPTRPCQIVRQQVVSSKV